MLNFLILDLYEVTDIEKKLIFFYKTYTSEVYHEEVSTWEESKFSICYFLMKKMLRLY